MVRGTVKEWDAAAGRGLLSSDDLPDDVAVDAHALHGRAAALQVGDEVLFDYEAAAAGAVAFRARWFRARPVLLP